MTTKKKENDITRKQLDTAKKHGKSNPGEYPLPDENSDFPMSDPGTDGTTKNKE